MIVAFRGHELPSGEFEVKEYCLPGVAPQKPLQQGTHLRPLLLSVVSIGSAGPSPSRPFLISSSTWLRRTGLRVAFRRGGQPSSAAGAACIVLGRRNGQRRGAAAVCLFDRPRRGGGQFSGRAEGSGTVGIQEYGPCSLSLLRAFLTSLFWSISVHVVVLPIRRAQHGRGGGGGRVLCSCCADGAG